MIFITEKAAKKIKAISDDEDIGYYIIRIKQIGGGCSGMSTDLFFDETINLDTDEVFELDDVKVVVDQFSFQYLDGTSVDYEEHDFGGGFKFINPILQSSCGCGKSQGF